MRGVNNTTLRPYLCMLVGSFAFAWMGILAHEAGKDYDWQIIAIVRCSIPLAIVGTLALSSGTKLVFLRPRSLWMRSVSGSLSLVGTFFALPLLPAADVFTITNIFPIWVALLSWPMLGERPTRQVWLSVLCGICGVALIQQPHLSAANYVVLVPLAVSVFAALAMIGLHRLKGVGTQAVVVHFHMVALCFAWGSFFLMERERTFYAPEGWVSPGTDRRRPGRDGRPVHLDTGVHAWRTRQGLGHRPDPDRVRLDPRCTGSRATP